MMEHVDTLEQDIEDLNNKLVEQAEQFEQEKK